MTKTNPHDVVTMTPDPTPMTDGEFVARYNLINCHVKLIEAERQRDIHAGDLALLAEQMRAWADDLNTGRLDLAGVIEALRSVAADVEAGLEESR